MSDSRRYRKSRRYDDYSDSDDDSYYSDDNRRHRARSLERDDRRRAPPRYRSRDDYYRDDHRDDDRRRPRSLDRGTSSRHYDSRSRGADRDYDRSRDRPLNKEAQSNLKIQHAVQAGLKAGALEAFRLRKEPGPWTGSKGARIATAAFGAAMADTALEKNHNPEKNRKKNSMKATWSGLVLNRFLDGPRNNVRGW